MHPRDYYPSAVLLPGAVAPAGWLGVPVELLLAEPPVAHPSWVTSVVGRLAAMTSGPVLLGRVGEAQRPLAERLERAGLFALEAADLMARDRLWPAREAVAARAPVLGSPRPKLVLVVEREAREPLLHSVAGAQVFRALRHLGWDELQVLVTCARVRDVAGGDRRRSERRAELRELAAAVEGSEPTWVALGPRVGEVLGRATIQHVRVPEPHASQRSGTPPEAYAEAFRRAGLPDGPGKVVGVQVPEARPLPPPFEVLRLETRKSSHASSATSGVAPDRLAKTRQYYVTMLGPGGERVASLAEACRHGGADEKKVGEVARDEDWLSQRDAHQKKVVQRAQDTAVEASAKRVRLLVEVTEKAALDYSIKFLRNLQKEPAEGERPLVAATSARDLKALVEALALVRGVGDAVLTGEGERVRKLTLPEVARELLDTLRSQFGEDAVSALGLPPQP